MDVSNAKIKSCIVHKVGNKSRGEDLGLASKQVPISEDLERVLLEYFLSVYKNTPQTHLFHHETDLNLNEVSVCVENMVQGKDFIENSINIANHLYEQGESSAIKAGELFVVTFTDVVLEGIICDAIGVFKSEKKDEFVVVDDTNPDQLELEVELGIAKNKLDKGCLVIDFFDENDEAEKERKVYLFERGDIYTEYWRDKFLSVQPKDDNFHKTQSFLHSYKEYVNTDLPEQCDMSRAEQIDLVNRSVDYFKKNREFERTDFEQAVLEQPEVIDSFNSFADRKSAAEQAPMDNFVISKNALKKEAKYFKSVLKLDKNFHIYIHGNRNLIEQGYDEGKNKRYYKVYFDQEQ